MLRRMRLLLPLGLGALVTFASASAHAEHAALPPELIALDSPEGERLLAESNARNDFFKLTWSFVTQERPSFCGVASAVTVLNALEVEAPQTDVGRQFTQVNFFGPEAQKVYPSESVAKGGVTLGQLADLIQTHAAKADVIYGSDLTIDDMRARLSKNLATAGDFVIVNYARGEVGQETLGHISPLGAYHAGSDRFLLLDVARYKYPPVWVTAEALLRAVKTTDQSAGKSRGFLTVSAAKAPPGPAGRSKARSPIVMLGGIVAASFLVGLGIGLVIGRARGKRAAAS